MLDFSLVRTPPGDADTLVLPPPVELARAAAAEARRLGRSSTPILQTTLAEVRKHTRDRIAGDASRPVIVTGHQPGFMHAGVWAKHIVAQRLADAMGGVAINLVVDSDAPAAGHLAIPTTARGELEVVNLPIDGARPGLAYEEFARWDPDRLSAFGREVRGAMGDRFEQSMMPAWLAAFADAAGDWVAQAMAARQAVEARFSVSVKDVRISEAWCGAMTADLLLRAGEFRAAYNASLADYRRRHRVRSAQRPIPDLAVEGNATETPIWVYAAGQPRRRLFVEERAGLLGLRAERELVAEVARRDMDDPAAAHERLRRLGVKLRPRALALTLWARLALADIFIHGIGGAKYDRITDDIIRRQYGLDAPVMGCVSATLRLPWLPAGGITRDEVRSRRHAVHDIRCNPERHVSTDAPELRQAVAAVERALKAVRRQSSAAVPADQTGARPAATRSPRGERRRAYLALREARAALHKLDPELFRRAAAQAVEGEQALRLAATATGREYFFGLFPAHSLQRLLDALPAADDFAL